MDVILGRKMLGTCDPGLRRILAGRRIVIGSDETGCTITTIGPVMTGVGGGGEWRVRLCRGEGQTRLTIGWR